MPVQPLGREDPLEEETAIHASILTWRIPWTKELGTKIYQWFLIFADRRGFREQTLCRLRGTSEDWGCGGR